jgi:hypothetical protein
LFDAGNGQRLMNPLTDPDQEKVAARLRMGNIGTDQGTDPSRVHEGHFREINNECLRSVGPDLGLKFEQRDENERTV